MRKLYFIAAVIFIHSTLYSAPERKISWESVPGAWGYLLEIENSAGNKIVNTETRSNSYSVAQFESGEYRFRITTINLLKQKGGSTDWIKFSVEKLYPPKLKSVSKRTLMNSRKSELVIKGSNFRPESRFVLRGNGKEIELPKADINSADEAEIKFKPDSSSNGVYDLVVINRGDVEDVIKNAVEIVDPVRGAMSFSISAGYMAGYPFGTWADYVAPTYAGGRISLQFSPLQNFQLGIEGEGAQYKNIDTVMKFSLLYASGGLNAGCSVFINPINTELFLRVSGGYAYTVLTLKQFPLEEKVTSMDRYATAGAGFRFYPGKSFFIEPFGRFKTVFYKSEKLYEADAIISVGISF